MMALRAVPLNVAHFAFGHKQPEPAANAAVKEADRREAPRSGAQRP
jgi:hypothetical protein